MLLVIDNYDSSTYNLVDTGELGAGPVVHRNDAISVEGGVTSAPRPSSPRRGPARPARPEPRRPAGTRGRGGRHSALRSCLGHQAIGEAFGGKVVRADRLMHGKTTMVAHTGHPLFAGLPSPFEAMRYHSLVVAAQGLPPELEVTAWSADRPPGAEIMGLAHRSLPVYGVQFHPESVGTAHGKRILVNFLTAASGS